METALWKRNIVNTITNYANQFLKILNSFIITRILFENFGGEGYGIWTFLWVFFGYTIILDFGLGSSVKKMTAEFVTNKDIEKLNRGISTVFFSYCLIGCVIALLTYFSINFYENSFMELKESPFESLQLFKYFGYSMALIFPFGIFSEVQNGLHRIDIRNFVSLCMNIINVIGIYLLSQAGESLLVVVSFSLFTHLLGPLCNFATCFKLIKGFRVFPHLYDKSILKEVFRFSLNSYLSNFIIIIVQKFDQLIIGVVLGLGAVGFYQVATRLGNLLKVLTEQYQDNVAPLTARRAVDGKDHEFSNWIIEVNKLSSFFTAGVFAFLFIYADVFLKVWLKIDDPSVILIAHLSLAYTAINSVQRSVSCHHLLMSGEDNFLAKLSVLEVICNIILSVTLISSLGIIGVVLGTIIPGIIAGQIVYRKSIRKTGLNKTSYSNTALFSVLIISIVPYLFRSTLSNFMLGGIIELGIVFASHLLFVILNIYFFVLGKSDRSKLNDFFYSILPLIGVAK